MLTPLAPALVMVETTDLVFAVDSIPAIFAVTADPFLVFTSNVFAILGLRSLYFALAGALHAFHYMKHALAVVLLTVGVKMLAHSWLHRVLGPDFNLYLLAAVLAILGIRRTRLNRRAAVGPTNQADDRPRNPRAAGLRSCDGRGSLYSRRGGQVRDVSLVAAVRQSIELPKIVQTQSGRRPSNGSRPLRRRVMRRWLETLGQDLGYAVRSFRRSPAFVLVALLSLTLGIGATSAIFSVIYGVLIAPYPYARPGRSGPRRSARSTAAAGTRTPWTSFAP